MSKSNASAKNRRAFGGNSANQISSDSANTTQMNNNAQSGLTLQQVISLIDKRLINLETFVKDSNENSRTVRFEEVHTNDTRVVNDNTFSEIINEFNHRFDLFAEEIGNLKDIVLKLQSYTMDVNKTLLEERIQVFSDLGTSLPTNEMNSYSIANPNSEEVEEENSNDFDNDEKFSSVDIQNLVREEFSNKF